MRADDALIAELLVEMEHALRQLDRWEVESPSAEALASTIPFCFDTLEFHQWLQWIFLPRMNEVLSGRWPWPVSSDMFPIADHSFAESALDARRLLALIRRFDAAITGSRAKLS